MKKKLVVVVVAFLLVAGLVVAVVVKNAKDERRRQELMTNAQQGADSWDAYRESAQAALDAKKALATMRELVIQVDARRTAGFSDGKSVNEAMSGVLAAAESDAALPWVAVDEKLSFLVSNIGLQMEIYQKSASDADLEKLKLLIAEEESACNSLLAIASDARAKP